MRDILADVDCWIRDDKPIALAIVIQTWGSSPRRAGAKMALASDGQFSGSVSGGCVENAVIEAAVESLKTDQSRLLHFGVADETAWEVGLACGGSMDIFVKPLDLDFFEVLRSAWLDDHQSVHVTVIRGPADLLGCEMLIREDGQMARTFNDRWGGKILESANEVLLHGKSCRLELDAEAEIFL